MKFDEELMINENLLDKEWLKQPKVFMKISVESAEARKAYEQAKLYLDCEESAAYQEIMNDPEQFGLAKTTEAAIKSALKIHPAVVKAQNKVIDAKYEMDVMAAAVQAFDQRKRALENLVVLHGQSYFATPTVKGADKEAMEELEKRSVRSRRRVRKQRTGE